MKEIIGVPCSLDMLSCIIHANSSASKQSSHVLTNFLIFFNMCFLLAQASGLSELIGPPPLAYKKWRFDGQNYITDIASCGEL